MAAQVDVAAPAPLQRFIDDTREVTARRHKGPHQEVKQMATEVQ
jgi:hypothetical protein